MSDFPNVKPKKIVHYVGKPIFYGEMEHGAFIYPMDHPDTENVSNMKQARTSSVLSYDPVTGRMETLNTVYMPIKEEAEPRVLSSEERAELWRKENEKARTSEERSINKELP
jgi:hypothetical protein